MAAIAQEQNEQNELFNIFHRLDWMDNWLKNGKGELTPQIFWSLIDIRIPLDLVKYNKSIRWATSGPGNASNGNGWGVIQQKLAPHLYEKVNAQPNIMDWRATEAVCNHYMIYKGLNYPLDAHKKNNFLFGKYQQSHAVLSKKYKEILEFAFGRDEFMKFLESSDVEFANMKLTSVLTGKEVVIRNVARSFPNYWYDSNEDPKPTYLYHYKKMNFLLKTIADCNYLAFDIIFDKLNVQQHQHLLHGYITLNSNNDQKKSNIRSHFHNMNLDYNDLTKPYTATVYGRYGDSRETHPAPAESFSDESSPFNPDTIDNAVSGAEEKGSSSSRYPTDLFLEVAERSGIRQRHSNNYGYTSLKPDNRSDILAGKWKYDWLFQHTYAGEGNSKSSHKVGDIQPGLDKKYILTFILQHAYETNDRRLYESYRRFRHIYGKDYWGDKPDTTATKSPYFEAHHYGGGGDKDEWMKIRTFEFVDEQLPQRDSLLNISACERWLNEYNKKLINIGQKFLKKLEFHKYITVKNNQIEFEKKRKEIRDATKFFLASVDKKALQKGTNGSFENGHSNTTSAFMVENQDWIIPAKRAWLWWTKNDITLKDRVKKDQAKLAGMREEYVELIGSEGFSGFWGIVNLFGSTYDLNSIYYYTQEQLQAIVSILTFKQTLNNIFEKEYEKQKNIQRVLDLLVIDRQLKGMGLKREKNYLSSVKSVLSNKDLINKIVTFGGGKRRKKTKSKYNKRMTKRTRRKRGGGRISRPNDLTQGTTYKITFNGETNHHEYVGNGHGLMNTIQYVFEPSFPLPIYFGSLQEDGWFDGTGSEDVPTDSDNIQDIPEEGFFMWSPQGRKILTIETIDAGVETGGRRRRRKRRKRKTKKKRHRRRKYTKKKRRKRRKLN